MFIFPAVRKDATSNSNSFLGLKNLDPNWHQMASYGSKLNFDKTDLDHFLARVFFYFQKTKYRVSGTNTKNRWRVRSVKNSKSDFCGFPGFSRGQIVQTSQTPTRMIFPRPPKPPKPSKHVSTVGFYVFWHEGTVRCMRLFVPPGQCYVCRVFSYSQAIL